MKMSKRTKLAAAGGTLVLAGFAAGAAAAVTGSASAVGDTLSGVSLAPDGRGEEELLTGTTAEKVTAAVEAAYPNATIERVETDSEGVYEALVVTSAGEELTVQVGEDFRITGTQTGGHGFHGDDRGGDQGDQGDLDDSGDDGGVSGDAA